MAHCNATSKTHRGPCRSIKRRRQQQQDNRLDFQSLEDRKLLATFSVTTLADGPVSGPGDLPGSLRQAIFDANANGEINEISFAAAGSIELISELPTISSALTIDGANQITIDAGDGADDRFGTGDGFRIFNVDEGTSSTIDVTLAGLTLTGGDAANGDGLIPAESGGAVLTRENLTIIESTISGNSAGDGGRGGINGLGDDGTAGGSGGGIRSYGTLALVRSTVSGNQAGRGGNGRFRASDAGNGGLGGSGGGVFSSGTMSVVSSTISANRAGQGGDGGDFSTSGGDGISGDGGGGGGIFSSGTLTVTSSTVSGNRAANPGYGGFYIDEDGESSFAPYGAYGTHGAGGGINSTGSLTLTNSIVARNRGFYSFDLQANPVQPPNASFSLIGNKDGSGLNEAQTADAQGNLIGSVGNRVAPLLGPLADNGGPTLTHALLPGSPAINSGVPSSTEPTDQRGFSLSDIDMGSFERQAIESTTLFVTSTTNSTFGDGFDSLTLPKAIELTNQNPGPDTIKFGSLFDVERTIRLSGNEMEITDTLSIEGPGRELLTIDGGQDDERIFNFSASTGNLNLSGLRLTGGRTLGSNTNAADHTFDGGGIRFLSSGVLTLTNSTVEGNSTSGSIARGGGIFTEGSLVLNNSTVSGNSTAQSFSHGGGIYTAAGTISLNQSTVSDNSTAGPGSDGGGIHTRGSNLSIINSTVSGNSTSEDNADGGGIYTRAAIVIDSSTLSGNHTSGNSADGGGIFSTAAVTLVNSTVSSNYVSSLPSNGGGIAATDDLTILQSTVTNNNVPFHFSSQGGGVWHDSSSGTIQVVNSIIAGNFGRGGSADIAQGGSGLDIDRSLVGVANGLDGPTVVGFNQSGNATDPLDPELGPLTNNGGSTKTHSLLAGSPAIDAGSNALAVGQSLTLDQRGFNRIFDAEADGSATVDIGAVELNAPLVLSTMRDEGGVLERPDSISTFSVTFNADVAISAGDLMIRNDTLGELSVDTSTLTFIYDAASRTATWDFSSIILEPAFYSFELSDTITSGGLNLDGDANGTVGGSYVEPVYVALPGDLNLDGQVNVLGDAFALVGNLGLTGGATWADGDVNDDDAVNVLGDAFILIGRLGQSVVPAAEASASATAKAAFITAPHAVATPVNSISNKTQPVGTTSDDRDQIWQAKRSIKSPTPQQLSLAGSCNIDAAFESSDLFEAEYF